MESVAGILTMILAIYVFGLREKWEGEVESAYSVFNPGARAIPGGTYDATYTKTNTPQTRNRTCGLVRHRHRLQNHSADPLTPQTKCCLLTQIICTLNSHFTFPPTHIFSRFLCRARARALSPIPAVLPLARELFRFHSSTVGQTVARQICGFARQVRE
jgi:hypothetical protein